MGLFRTTLEDATKEIDRGNYIKAKKIIQEHRDSFDDETGIKRLEGDGREFALLAKKLLEYPMHIARVKEYLEENVQDQTHFFAEFPLTGLLRAKQCLERVKKALLALKKKSIRWE